MKNIYKGAGGLLTLSRKCARKIENLITHFGA
jgi:hypothetical protein